MKKFVSNVLKGTAVVAVVGTVAAVLYRRYLEDTYAYIPEDATADPDEADFDAACEEVPTEDDFVSTVDESEPETEQ